MAGWQQARWEPSFDTALPRADRRHGVYRCYVPDMLEDRPLVVGGELSRKAAIAERAVRSLTMGPQAASSEGLSRFLLRSEAIASSQIKGIAPSPQQVALAELAQDENVRGFSDQARTVANNITLLRRAARELATADEVGVGDAERLHRLLLPQERHHGLRDVQNWIGGSNWHPLDADFVPPPPEAVPSLMTDLMLYLNGSAHAPLVQAALVHAQFETIHPFTDGNGRVGRALIHTVLTRRGLTPQNRYTGAPTGPSAHGGVAAWLDIFLEATVLGAEQARTFAKDVLNLRVEWERQLADYRTRRGLRSTPRSDSATSRLLALLPAARMLTTATVQRLLGVSFPPARAALEELADAGVLSRRRGARRYRLLSTRCVLAAQPCGTQACQKEMGHEAVPTQPACSRGAHMTRAPTMWPASRSQTGDTA